MDVSIRVLKEPRGFIRVIQMVMAILAFATTAGFSTSISFLIECTKSTEKHEEPYEFKYPFQIINHEMDVPDCSDNDNTTPNSNDKGTKLPFDFSDAAEFFVGVGVVSFLYCIIILIVYICFHQTYANNTKVPVVDFGFSTILCVFWLAGSSAWAQGVIDLKYYMDPEKLCELLPICSPGSCTPGDDGDYASLNVSLVFGFANFLLWLGSLWFVYKETIFHSPTVVSTAETKSPTTGDGRV